MLVDNYEVGMSKILWSNFVLQFGAVIQFGAEINLSDLNDDSGLLYKTLKLIFVDSILLIRGIFLCNWETNV